MDAHASTSSTQTAVPVGIGHFFDANGRILTMEAMEKKLLEVALFKHRNLSEAARRLNIGRRTLYRKIELYGL